MGILLVYDVTDEASFNNIRNWMRNIEQHASDTVNKVQSNELYIFLNLGYRILAGCIALVDTAALPEHMTMLQILVGNKCDMDESKRKVPFNKGQALADEFGIRFFETSAKTNSNVDEVRTIFACVEGFAWTI